MLVINYYSNNSLANSMLAWYYDNKLGHCNQQCIFAHNFRYSQMPYIWIVNLFNYAVFTFLTCDCYIAPLDIIYICIHIHIDRSSSSFY